MNKKIEFRAWDSVAKKYLKPWPDGFHVFGEVTCFDLIGLQLSKRNPEITTLEKLNDIILEQYTGLKDENGKEIFKGDICTADYHCPICYDNEPHKITGTIDWDDNSLCWMFDYGHGATTLSNENLDNLVCISNIHENSELLGDKNGNETT